MFQNVNDDLDLDDQNHRHKRIDRLLIGPACLPCFGFGFCFGCIAVAPQSGAKQFFIFYFLKEKNMFKIIK